MLVKLTTLASSFKSGSGPILSTLEASTEYLFNTKNFSSAKAYDTNDMEFRYMFEPNDRQASPATIRVDETLAATTTEAAYDAPAASQTVQWITLNVYEEEDTSASTESYRFHHDAISFAETYSDSNITSKARIYVNEGGFGLKRYVVNHTIAAIETLAQSTS